MQFRANLPNDFSSIQPAGKLVKLTKGSAMDACRGLLVGNSGTANITDLAGTAHTDVPLQEGYNPIGISAIASGGTATDIWALYT